MIYGLKLLIANFGSCILLRRADITRGCCNFNIFFFEKLHLFSVSADGLIGNMPDNSQP